MFISFLASHLEQRDGTNLDEPLPNEVKLSLYVLRNLASDDGWIPGYSKEQSARLPCSAAASGRTAFLLSLCRPKHC